MSLFHCPALEFHMQLSKGKRFGSSSLCFHLLAISKKWHLIQINRLIIKPLRILSSLKILLTRIGFNKIWFTFVTKRHDQLLAESPQVRKEEG